ncbi:HET-domain-containing protein [Amniculicola lignicola CBS 123094]|uniref:HET-domain-containing protein n=1 Tax=Amniculicola lignicola CBS 123094 TaxID=1392246 RepID=A0A6A5VYY4_9PLEO|nr:HET-domain-containing protein [Amniculicola lignicola CBS 123094]
MTSVSDEVLPYKDTTQSANDPLWLAYPRGSQSDALPINSFCDICWSIHHAKIFETTVNTLPSRCIARIPTPSASTSCASCRFFASFIKPQVSVKRLQPTSYILYEVSLCRFYALDSSPPTYPWRLNRSDSLWILVPGPIRNNLEYPKQKFQAIRSRYDEYEIIPTTDKAYISIAHSLRALFDETVGDIGNAQSDPIFIQGMTDNRGFISRMSEGDLRNQRSRYLPRLLDPARIEYSILKGWLTYCGEHHTLSCAKKTPKLPQSFTVIDCVQDTTDVLPEGQEFIALSYVWGPPGLNEEQVPLTVQDAKKVTVELGFRYLWVDRYCISSEASVKHEQIMNMDLVYQCAYATIVAVVGEDPSFGLPGVSTRRRTEQPHIRIRNGSDTSASPNVLVSTLTDPGLSINQSKWATRAWTYQECLLSRRRIFFTSEQVYFECQSMHCRESMDEPLDAIHNTERTGLCASVRRGIYPKEGLGRSPKDIWERVAEYTRRSMTYDSDALNGLVGLLRAYRKLDKPVYHIWGLPIFALRDNTTFHIRSEQDIFVTSLCWHLPWPSIRRHGFPSWSWTGWKSGVDSRHARSLLGGSFVSHDILSVNLGFSSGERIPWDETLQRAKSDNLTHRTFTDLHIYSWCIKIWFQRNQNGEWNPCGGPERKSMGSPLYLCKEDIKDKGFRKRLETQTFTGILLGLKYVNGNAKQQVILVVDEEPHERIGFLRLGMSEMKPLSKLKRWVCIR